MYKALSLEGKIKFSKGYIEEVKSTLDTMNHQEIGAVLEMIEDAFINGNKIFIAGNGGSAATGSHMASDLQKTTLGKNPQSKNHLYKFKTIALSDNIPVMTAWGNDEGFEFIFSEQLEVLGDKGDILIIITGSGNSNNIIKTIEKAKEMEIKTIGFLGFDGGKAKGLLDAYVLVDSDNYGPIEDIHMILDHLITGYFKGNIQ